MSLNITILGTKHTPHIEFDADHQRLSIVGDSYPENAGDTYFPVVEKLDVYFNDPGQFLRVELTIPFANTSSSKVLTDLFTKFQGLCDQGHKIELTWFYPYGDYDCRENGELLLEDVEFPYKMVELSE